MTDNTKPTVQEKTAWTKVPQEFNDWWNSDYSDESNPFRINSAAYWAWAGWSEAVRLNAQAVPDGYALVDREALDMAINALRRDANEGRPIRGEIANRLSAAPAAPQPAQQPLTDEHKTILKECRNQAMKWTADARIPEAGAFGGIAQDLDYLCGQLGVKP